MVRCPGVVTAFLESKGSFIIVAIQRKNTVKHLEVAAVLKLTLYIYLFVTVLFSFSFFFRFSLRLLESNHAFIFSDLSYTLTCCGKIESFAKHQLQRKIDLAREHVPKSIFLASCLEEQRQVCVNTGHEKRKQITARRKNCTGCIHSMAQPGAEGTPVKSLRSRRRNLDL